MPSTRKIKAPTQLVVEGRDAEVFFSALLEHMQAHNVQVQDFGGTSELAGFLKALRITPGFSTRVSSLGIIRDAETGAPAAFQSVQSALTAAQLPVPSAPNQPTGDNPRVSIFILPDNRGPGMLETLCLAAVTGDPVMPCVETYLECVQQYAAAPPRNLAKAKVQAFLASRDRPGQLREAARRGYWPWDDPTFALVKQFLQAL